MAKEGKGEEVELVKTGEYSFRKKKRGYISEFFNHMITYGGFDFNDGIMTVWGDTSLFVPLDGLVIYYSELKKIIGKKADEIFYWIGHLYGKNSSLMLMRKFGFDRKKVSDFVNGATQDGFGYIDIREIKYDSEKALGYVESSNSNFSKRYAEMFGKQKIPLDYYIGGVLAGGSEPLFDFNVSLKEEKCMGKGDKICTFKLVGSKKRIEYKFFDEIGLNEEQIRKKTEALGQKRKIDFKMIGRKDIKFGDGSFILRGYRGFNLASYEIVLLDLISKKFLGEKKFIELKEKVAKEYIKVTLNKELYSKIIISKQVESLINHLKIFGYGHLVLERFQNNIILIKNAENPYLNDQLSLLGKEELNSSDFFSMSLKNAFKTYYGKEIKISATKLPPNQYIFKINF